MCSFDPFSSETEFAIRCVRDACTLTQSIEEKMVVPALEKDDRSPVTVADFSVQALVGREISRFFSEVPLVAEESLNSLGRDQAKTILDQSAEFLKVRHSGVSAQDVAQWIERGQGEPEDRFWILDPVDGTKGFLRGGQYAVAMALAKGGRIQVGVLGCPHLNLYSVSQNTIASQPGSSGGTIAVAVRGQGAWVSSLANREFQSLRVSSHSEIGKATILRSFESGHTNEGQMKALVQALRSDEEPIRMDSQAKYLMLAAGRGDLMLRLLSADAQDYREKIWDQAAGSIVVEEAGGEITDLYGFPLDFTTGRLLANNRGILASNGALHEAALNVLFSIGAGGR